MEKIILNISGMHCASCASNIKDALKKVKGVFSARVNFVLEKAYIEFEPEMLEVKDLITAIKNAGYKAEISETSVDKERELRDREVRSLKIKFIISIILSSILMYISMAPCVGLGMHKFIMENMALLQFLLATFVLFCGYQFFTRGVLTLIKAHRANMDTLISLGVGSAYLYSLFVSINLWFGDKTFGMDNLYYEVAAFLLSFILLGKYLEAITKRKTSQAIKRLWDLRPKIAFVMRDDKEEEVSIEELVVGDIVLVKPGQRVPVDGKIIEGYSGVDESMITGESIPVEKSLGDNVIGGSINKSGAFTFKATKVGKETTLAQIIRLIEEAQGSKAPIQELADKISSIFVPAVLVIAILSFVTWILLGKSFIFALTTFISVLIIACPCSLGLATPTAVMVATGKAAENGIIIKNANSLQIAREVKTIIFDKTGTLTKGRPKVTDIQPQEHRLKVLQLAAIAEKNSEHPLAEAIVEGAKKEGIIVSAPDDFISIGGKGIIARHKQEEIILGNRILMQDKDINISYLEDKIKNLELEGKTVMILARDKEAMGLVACADTLKDFSKEAISALQGLGKEVIMISGDNRATSEAIAKNLGIKRVLAEVLPADKVNEIKKIQSEGINLYPIFVPARKLSIKKIQSGGVKVAMVGDGINDAPALAQADIGIAVGTGTDVAIESADFILIKDDLRDVVSALDLSRYAMKKIKQNLLLAFFYNSLAIPVAAGVFYPINGFLLNPVLAGLAMAASSISVVLNSLLIKRYKPKIG